MSEYGKSLMREIKFRGKRVDNGEWMWGYLHHGMISGYSFSKGTQVVIPETVGQYTGLKDKNGKEIYEGDILKITETNEKCIVFYNSAHAAYMLDVINPQGKNSRGYYKLGSIFNLCLEVIGNIYDNPELMEDKNEKLY